jgi:hypothetical protein
MTGTSAIGCRPGRGVGSGWVLFRGGWRVICSLLMWGLAAAGCWLPAPTVAHQWYPKACCNEQDCFAADRVVRRSDGALEIQAGPVHVLVPPGFEARASRDNRVHVCVWRDGVGKYHARCLFLPGIG